MFGVEKLIERVKGLERKVGVEFFCGEHLFNSSVAEKSVINRINDVKQGVDALRSAVIVELQHKNDAINKLNRKVDALLDYLGLKYSPEIVHIDCIEKIETDNKKGKK